MSNKLVGKPSPRRLEKLLGGAFGAPSTAVLVGPGAGLDAAVLDLGDGRVMAIAEDPIFPAPKLPLEIMGWFTVHIGASDVAVTGVRPQYMTYTLLLPGTSPEEEAKVLVDSISEAAKELADVIVRHEIELVYGGASVGTMGVIADTVLALGGKVHGVIPRMLYDKEIAHQDLTELHIVNSMHERKTMMAALSDGFIAMPGGFGTLEEIIEIVTWGQLRFHDKPCGLLNVSGYFDHLLAYLDHAQHQGFLKPENRRMLLSNADPAALVRAFERYEAPKVDKWL